VLLPRDDAPEDLWEEAETGLAALLRERPDVERVLLAPDPSGLGPADLFFRALAMEERGDFAAARVAAERADAGLYPAETRACRDRVLDALVETVAVDGGLVVDLATGRGTLLERLAVRLDRPLVATDASPRVLVRTGRALDDLGLGANVSLLACDARRLPFRAGAVDIVTSHLGLANVLDPGPLLQGLRRAVSGRLLALTFFFPPADDANRGAIERLGLERMVYRDELLAELSSAGWEPRLAIACSTPAEPTPVGLVVEGATIDALPVADTTVEWALVEAR
jgi:hypothetical protein